MKSRFQYGAGSETGYHARAAWAARINLVYGKKAARASSALTRQNAAECEASLIARFLL
jgi:hypothetical protein